MLRIIIIAAAVVMIAAGALLAGRSGKSDKKIVTSQTLQTELNEERKREGKDSLPAINSGQCSTNTYALRDKSWKSVPDFFIQLVRGRRQ